MVLYCTTRCFIFYFLIFSLVIGWYGLSDGHIHTKEQVFQKIDIFDIFNDIDNQVPKSTDDTYHYASTEKKEQVNKSTPSHVCFYLLNISLPILLVILKL
jgi:hypothetical protein